MRMTYDPAQEQPFSPGVCWRAPPSPPRVQLALLGLVRTLKPERSGR